MNKSIYEKKTGLSETLGQIYGENTIFIMIQSKAYSRLLRGYFIFETALNKILRDSKSQRGF